MSQGAQEETAQGCETTDYLLQAISCELQRLLAPLGRRRRRSSRP